ncbi:16S rRNA (uracil1498-N3)-methyltransferase [Natranaerovirga hydrolytica]|uniref:Ribosomal RNA small subunit methyltransferase E n=1 Tax=Natranaerovirga hydrolytica TaxID=680378 RepID=A0A4R1MYM0_9FIRM|nr:16S rRNA (uracil(1498)-N(3))-methyltransferase [Natranaerovirga hydrolytica]TCK98397.1 16S rRNA (uracil1498-N3)-methyltransferase [Natranaerovirga hydrolytica]
MHRFFIEEKQIDDNKIKITGSDFNHIKNVLRLKIGDEIEICNGQAKEYCCIIDEIHTNEIIAIIQQENKSNTELKTKIILFQGLPKNDKLELIIQKAVELGVFEIVPIQTKRTIVKLDKKKESKKIERWNGISLAAAKQSKRGIIPKVKNIMIYKEALDYATSQVDVVVIPYEKATNMKATKEIIDNLNVKTVGIFIGPEGGFEEEEIKQAVGQGAKPITLGKRILRTETAGLSIISILMYRFEEE